MTEEKPKPKTKPVHRNRLLEQLAATYSVIRDYKPLAIGIHKGLLERMPELDKAQLRVAMRTHTASTAYLKGIVEGASRLDLDGNPAGTVTAEHQELAVKTLRERLKKAAERRKAEQEEKQRQEKLAKLAEKFNTR